MCFEPFREPIVGDNSQQMKSDKRSRENRDRRMSGIVFPRPGSTRKQGRLLRNAHHWKSIGNEELEGLLDQPLGETHVFSFTSSLPEVEKPLYHPGIILQSWRGRPTVQSSKKTAGPIMQLH